MKSVALKVAGIYVAVSFLWIIGSDSLLSAMVRDQQVWSRVSVLKGWCFVLVTGAMLYALIVRYTAARERIREAQQQSETRFRSVFEGSPIGIAICRDDALLYVNPAFRRMFGEDDGASLADRGLVEFTEAPARATMLAHLRRCSGAASGNVEFEAPGVRRDGATFPCLIAATPIGLADGAAVLLFLTDLTERKQLEARLLHAQKMESVGRLAGGVAHDFNNILTAVLGYADLLDVTDNPEARTTFVEGIRTAALRAAGLTRQLLAFARKQVIEPRVVDLNELVSDMERMLRHVVGEDIELRAVRDASSTPAKVDPGQIEQVIMNLVVNARDAMPYGGTLTIQTANVAAAELTSVGLPASATGAYVVVSVSDTGEGMSEEARAHAFEPFFTTKEFGTGLGLATSFGIVRQAGGHIALASEPGCGTTFRIALPRATGPCQPSDPLPGRSDLGGGETVLVVEDEPLVRDIEVRGLRSHGYTVLEADSGPAALSVAAAHTGSIDLLVTDVVMPTMDGVQLAEQLVPARPGMRVLFMSGYSRHAVTQDGTLAPGAHLLQKPFTTDALARKVREVLDAPREAGN